jgi:transposase-like protein
MAKWRRHSMEFKRQAVERMKGCDNLHALARELEVERKLLYTWKYQWEGRPEPRHANLAESAGPRLTATETRSGASLRSRHPVCIARVRRGVQPRIRSRPA